MDNSQEILDQQRKSWDKFAPGWKKWDAFFMEFRRPVGAALMVGARVVGWRRELRGKVGAFDLSEQMVGVGAGEGVSQKLTNYHVQIGDATTLPYADRQFDAALCRFGIMFFPDPVLCLKEIIRTLKPGGKL